jgi:isopropylmalate/homocitrate/citramalate synthase
MTVRHQDDPTEAASIHELLFSWNPPATPLLSTVKIEDDTLRDGLQGAFIRKPQLEQKKELIRLSAAVGTQAAMLGFPAISEAEFHECSEILGFLSQEQIPIVPRFLARANRADVEPIIALDQNSDLTVWADFFIGSSPLRRHIEHWPMAQVLRQVRETGEFLSRNGTRFGVSLEDASRTPAADLREMIHVALDSGAEIITICDTVGDSTPAGAALLVSAAVEFARRLNPQAEIWWHGHNDRGLALANAIAAAEAGAKTISGSFLGIGERTGNTSLEQFVMFVYQCGHRGYRVDRLARYCSKLAEATATDIPITAPLIGDQAFATCTGTHSAAILKARALGIDFEDYVFSSVPASKLGRSQTIMIGPTSGLANARYVLRQLQLEENDENARLLLSYAKTKNSWLNGEQIRGLYAQGRRAGAGSSP